MKFNLASLSYCWATAPLLNNNRKKMSYVTFFVSQSNGHIHFPFKYTSIHYSYIKVPLVRHFTPHQPQPSINASDYDHHQHQLNIKQMNQWIYLKYCLANSFDFAHKLFNLLNTLDRLTVSGYHLLINCWCNYLAKANCDNSIFISLRGASFFLHKGLLDIH